MLNTTAFKSHVDTGGKNFFHLSPFFFSLILSLSPSPCFLSFNSIHEQNFTRTFRDFSCLRNLQFPGRISRFGKIIIFRDRSLPIGNPRYTENVAQKIIPRSIAPVIVTWNKRTEKKEKKKTYKSKSRIGFFSDFCFFLSFFFFFHGTRTKKSGEYAHYWVCSELFGSLCEPILFAFAYHRVWDREME